MKTSMIWKKLVVDNQRIITSNEILDMSKKLGKEYPRSLSYLQENGYIFRILRGIFYVKSPEERERGFFQDSVYEMVSNALNLKGVENWYFGLETALKLNNMTQEYFTINYVITDSYRTTKVIQILNSSFQFLKWNRKYFEFGIVKSNGLRFSDKEKTVLDLIYRRYRKNRDLDIIISPLVEFIGILDRKKLNNYLGNYSQRYQLTIRRRI